MKSVYAISGFPCANTREIREIISENISHTRPLWAVIVVDDDQHVLHVVCSGAGRVYCGGQGHDSKNGLRHYHYLFRLRFSDRDRDLGRIVTSLDESSTEEREHTSSMYVFSDCNKD